MAMKRILCVISCLMLSMSLLAQQDDLVRQIGKVKRDVNYIYAEATMKDKKEALDGAKAILEVKVSDWIHQQTIENVDVCIAKAKDHCFELQTMRGDYYRAFVYVNKQDILPVTDKKEVVVFQVGNSQSQEASAEVISEDSPSPTIEVITLTADEEKMKSITSFYEIQPYIESLKKSGRLDAYGKYSTMPKDGKCNLFVYDKQGKVVAALRKTGSYVLNIATLRGVNIKSYNECGAIWLRIK